MWNILIKCFCLHIYCTYVSHIRMCEKNCLIWIVGRFRECRWNVAQRYRTEVKSRCLANIEIQGGLTSDRYGCLICSRRTLSSVTHPRSGRCDSRCRPDLEIGLLGCDLDLTNLTAWLAAVFTPQHPCI